MTRQASDLLAAIHVNLETGEVRYPCPEGFNLDTERVASTARLFRPYCDTAEQAVAHAIHQQIIAFEGAADIRRLVAKG
jgi:hypothetical protein